MSFDRFHFTGYCHCPYCKTGLIIVDNKAVSCPVCELKRDEKAQKLEKEIGISTVLEFTS